MPPLNSILLDCSVLLAIMAVLIHNSLSMLMNFQELQELS